MFFYRDQVQALIKKLERTKVDNDQRHFVSLVTRSVLLNKPIDDVFAFVFDTAQWRKFIPGLKEMRNLSTPTIMPGSLFDWTMNTMEAGRMLGKIKDLCEGNEIQDAERKRFDR